MTTPTLSDVREVEQTILDADALNRLIEDAVHPPTCEVHMGATIDDPLCGKPASWLSVASCGHTAYYCDSCYRIALVHLELLRRRPACPLHGAKPQPITLEWRPL